MAANRLRAGTPATEVSQTHPLRLHRLSCCVWSPGNSADCFSSGIRCLDATGEYPPGQYVNSIRASCSPSAKTLHLVAGLCMFSNCCTSMTYLRSSPISKTQWVAQRGRHSSGSRAVTTYWQAEFTRKVHSHSSLQYTYLQLRLQWTSASWFGCQQRIIRTMPALHIPMSAFWLAPTFWEWTVPALKAGEVYAGKVIKVVYVLQQIGVFAVFGRWYAMRPQRADQEINTGAGSVFESGSFQRDGQVV